MVKSFIQDEYVLSSALEAADKSKECIFIIGPASPLRVIHIPYFEALVRAGFPSPAEGYQEERIDLNELVVKNPLSTFFVRVQGNSMIGSRIFDGSLLVVDRSAEVKENSNCLCFLNGEFTVKKIKRVGGKLYLTGNNPQSPMKPIEVPEGSDFAVWGVVTKVVTDPI